MTKYLPFTVKMFKGVTKLTVTIWEIGNYAACKVAKKKYSGYTIMLIQAQWHYKNKRIAI